MSANSSKFLIGLFVVTGILICTVVLIWIGAAKIFMKGSLYVAYFDESVQGLQTDSAIKYRGVDIGKVHAIRVAPDYRLIEVLMKIDLEDHLQHRTVASLKTAGITGIVFVELDKLAPSESPSSPELSFKPPYPVIPSRRSDISQFIGDTAIIMQSLKAIDFEGISDQIKLTAKAIEDLASSKKMQNILTRLESTSSNLEQAATAINKTIASGKMNDAMDQTVEALSDARTLIGQVHKEIDSLGIGDKALKADAVLAELDAKVRSITDDLAKTSENLRETSANLQTLSDSIKHNPTELFFEPPPPPRKMME